MKTTERSALKQRLLQHCKSILEKRITAARSAMEQAQEAANSEGKSSAGDKYETSRAMGQLDRDMNARQMEEAQRDQAFLNSIPEDSVFTSVQVGSVVVTDKNSFYISVGLGTILIDNQNYILLSAASPVAKIMTGKKAGESFKLNGQEIMIHDVY